MSTSITKKIALLMAKADSTNSAAEAQAFYAKAEELMLKHAVERAELEGALDHDSAVDEVGQVIIHYPQAKVRWKALGVFGTASLVEAIGLVGSAINNKNHLIWLYGRDVDIQHVQTILEAMWRQAEDHLKRFRKYDPEMAIYRQHRLERELNDVASSYVLGFARGAASKIREAREAMEANTPGTSLALVDAKKNIADAMAGDGVTINSRMRGLRMSAAARSAGFSAGRAATLGAQVTA